MKILLLVGSHLIVAGLAVFAVLQFGEDRATPERSLPTQVALAPEPPRQLPRPAATSDPVYVDPNSSIFGQQFAAHQLAAQSDEAALIDLLDEYLASSDPLGINIAMIFLERLMEIDIQAALDYVETARLPTGQRQQLLASVLTTWARYDPAATASYFSSLTNLQLKYQIGVRLLRDPVFTASGYQDQVLQALGPGGQQLVQHVENQQKSPEQVFQEALEARGNWRRPMLVSAIANWYEQDPEGALGALESVTSESDRRHILQSVIPLAAQADPFDAYELAQRYAPNDNQVLASAISAMMAADPVQGLPYLERHFEETGDINLMRQALSSWGHQDMEDALAYLDRIPVPGAVRRNIEMSLAFSFVQQDPDAAMRWAMTSDNEQLKSIVASTLGQTNVSVAEEWLDRVSDEQTSQALLNTIAQHRAQSGFDSALDWLQSYEDHPGYAEARSTIISTYAHTDPERAADYLGSLAEDDAYLRAFVTLASSWGYSDPDSAYDWVDSLPDSMNRDQAAHYVIRGAMNRDQDAALEMLDNLDLENTQQLRMELAMQLYQQNGDVESAIRRTGLTGELAEQLRQGPINYPQVFNAAPAGAAIIRHLGQ